MQAEIQRFMPFQGMGRQLLPKKIMGVRGFPETKAASFKISEKNANSVIAFFSEKGKKAVIKRQKCDHLHQ